MHRTKIIHEKMKVNEIVLNFPPKAQKLRRAIKNFASFPHDLPEGLTRGLSRQKWGGGGKNSK